MFGIGLPEMILILALALIVVGPDKLPELARSIAKGVMELKKTAEGLKHSLTEDGNPLDEIRPELEESTNILKENILEPHAYSWRDGIPPDSATDSSASDNENNTPSEEEEAPESEIYPRKVESNDFPATEEQHTKEKDISSTSKTFNSVQDDLKAGPKS